MTETKNQGSIAEAVTLIDRGLGDISERSLVSTAEVADLLLDLRSMLTREAVGQQSPASAN
ncbi:MAG TPA: hypothetical protein DEG43_00825 [Acidimicrobiaceae bacterium]|jgi:hypothetical protein|nr:hypothetical protein [Acidimicrobiaceae bacterium]